MILKTRVLIAVILVVTFIQGVCLAEDGSVLCYTPGQHSAIPERSQSFTHPRDSYEAASVSARQNSVPAYVADTYAQFNEARTSRAAEINNGINLAAKIDFGVVAEMRDRAQAKIDIGEAYFTHKVHVVKPVTSGEIFDKLDKYLNDPAWTVTLTSGGAKVTQKEAGAMTFVVIKGIMSSGAWNDAFLKKVQEFLADPTATVTLSSSGAKITFEDGDETFIVYKHQRDHKRTSAHKHIL